MTVVKHTDADTRSSRAPSAPATSRRRIVIALLGLLVVVLAALSVSVGAYTLTPSDLVLTLIGQGSGSDNVIVFRLRLPRVVLGILAGAAFAIAGALFQTILRNDLASPDIIGISGGASVSAATAILVFGASGAIVSLSAFAGALVVAAAIYLLSWRDGVSGYRFVLIGVGVAFLIQSALGYLLTRGEVKEVSQALVWMVGGVGGAKWPDIAVLAGTLVVLLPLVAALAPRLRVLQLGDDTAGGLGVPVEATRLALVGIAVALCATATAFVGPIAFVAFVSAPIARRVVRDGSLALVPSALVGAALVVAADFLAQHALPGELQVPAGILTGVLGAPYLLWLLATTNKGDRSA
ncbi:iron ABC transporter permease [Mycetocola manganoxydans]|uniref:Iron ABC transporter permease n=1 Tax=Mycetocola manganoxydans TaxID=699879 RepID=A0A3L6ZXP0_9MICO|nr:iron chelate uptake ABC transporter family permease subunit [Mycetocola manganoxydans]RLP72544.1 iron ABC transporter permease [Mycetocola manganoxydans]GHD39801.1 ABC transporter permease [Mycetocola manganoxydans]